MLKKNLAGSWFMEMFSALPRRACYCLSCWDAERRYASWYSSLLVSGQSLQRKFNLLTMSKTTLKFCTLNFSCISLLVQTFCDVYCGSSEFGFCFFSVVFACLGFLSPANRGALMTCALVSLHNVVLYRLLSNITV